MGSPREEAVLKAADDWLTTLEALIASREIAEGTEVRQEDADIAGVALVLAVTSWRSARDPS